MGTRYRLRTIRRHRWLAECFRDSLPRSVHLVGQHPTNHTRRVMDSLVGMDFRRCGWCSHWKAVHMTLLYGIAIGIILGWVSVSADDTPFGNGIVFLSIIIVAIALAWVFGAGFGALLGKWLS